ncbi:Zeta toxin family protein [Bremerella cremea]|uniref:Zeta toxin family protein n=1 Tax=Bremerella cremea TaxID=1031537 RepID=A0A368KNA3_9BACT|nr:zeta toxin family protein [Bremerella cremea]RCS44694.1 Zeta toxin family protein [Bremerella cremea]
MSRNVYVISGPNGAGKTTFATKFLPEFVQCKQFLNADLIAAGLAPFDPESQNFAAGKLMLKRIDELTAQRENFSFETTLSGRAYLRRFQAMKQAGYQIHLFFLWLPSEEVAIARVANRVKQGGHNIPEADIRRRYHSGVRNFWQWYAKEVDSWQLYNAMIIPPKLIAETVNDTITVYDKTALDTFKNSVERSRDA